MALRPSPINWQIPIVDTQGRPTPEFLRQWQAQRDTNGTIPALSTPAQVSAVLDVLAATRGALLVRGASQWGGLSAAAAGRVLTANGPALEPSWQVPAGISDLLDGISSVRGSVLYRGAAGWAALGPGTAGNVLQTNGAGADPSWAAGGGGGGGGSLPTRRGGSMATSTASSTFIAWPSGTVANDIAYLFGAGAYTVNLPTGWTQLHNLAGSNWNGGVAFKQLTSADITAGGVTLSFGGTFANVVAIEVTTQATTAGVRSVGGFRDASGVTSQVIGLIPYARANDLMLYFGSTRGNIACSVSRGSSIATSTNANASGCLYGENATGSSPFATYSYASSGSGHYEAYVCIGGP